MQHSNSDGSATNNSFSDHSVEMPDLDARTKGLLGRALRSHYDDLVRAPIPDRFLVLLAQLEAKEASDE